MNGLLFQNTCFYFLNDDLNVKEQETLDETDEILECFHGSLYTRVLESTLDRSYLCI